MTAPASQPGRILHLGCGRETLPVFYAGYHEVRFDIDPAVEPDIVGDITDLSAIDSRSFDIVYSSHVLEHLYEYQVVPTLKEMRRVLVKGGYAMINVPNLDDVRPTDETVYQSPVGPITGLDMFYGHTGMVKDNPYMAHKTGFTSPKMAKALEDAGFAVGVVKNIGTKTLMGIGINNG